MDGCGGLYIFPPWTICVAEGSGIGYAGNNNKMFLLNLHHKISIEA